MNMRKLACTFLIVIIVFVATFGFAVGVVSIPTIFSYAADEETSTIPPEYTQVSSNNQLGEGFLAYCKSRDSEITSSIVGSSATVAYNSLAKFCNYIGFNIADLQSHLWYLSENGQTKWFFDSTGINLYNRAFAYLIQENGLEVGDSADVTLYDGYSYNNYPIYIVTEEYTGEKSNNGHLIQRGYPYIYSRQQLLSSSSGQEYSFNFNNSEYTYTVVEEMISKDSNKTINPPFQRLYFNGYKKYRGSWIRGFVNFAAMSSFAGSSGNGYGYYEGNFAIIYNTQTNKYYFGMFVDVSLYDGGFIGSNNPNLGQLIRSDYSCWKPFVTLSSDDEQDIKPDTIKFISNTINNNTYEGDTIINNNGDVIVYPDNPDQPDPDNPYQPDPDDPTIPYNPYPDNPNYDPDDPNSPPGTITPPSDPNNPPDGSGGGTITFPDIDLNLPEINWSIGDLSDKFPFSIPFDLIAFFTVLNAPAEAPAIDADIPLGDWYTWHFEADFSQFDKWAVIIRNVEFIAFCIGLIYLTVKFVKG